MYSRYTHVSAYSKKPDVPIAGNKRGIAEIFKFYAKNTRANMTGDLYKSVKKRCKSLRGKGLVLQMRVESQFGIFWKFLPFVPTAGAVRTTASRRIINNSTKGYNLAFRYESKKDGDYISDACFRSAKNKLHGCDDFRKSSPAFRRISGNLAKWYNLPFVSTASRLETPASDDLLTSRRLQKSLTCRLVKVRCRFPQKRKEASLQPVEVRL